METKVMQVYYDSSAYPFKDQARETRYPVIGTSFTGASNTTRIRFYVNQFANIGTCTFVAITKLPSGKKLYEQLSKDTTSDTEPFVYLDISSAYTQEKGDIQIALNVYEGGVNISVDSDSGLYTISGSPIITATGNIKISVAYTPYMDINYGNVPTISVQQALALISGKLDETSGIVVVDNTDNISASVFQNGQMVYDKSTDIFYQVVSGEYVKQTLVDIAYEYAPSGSDVILTIKLSDGLGVYKTLTINLTTYLASLTYVNAHINDTSNPHSVTKAQVGLGNVVNTSDSNTPLENGTTKFTTGGAYNLQQTLQSAINTLNTNLKTYGKSLTIDDTDFKLRLLDGNGNTLSTIDLPLEELIVDGTFDSETQTIILTLFNGNAIEIPVADLVSGLVSTDDLETALSSYYTKSQVYTLLGAKANSSDVYTKTETNNLLSAKADKSTTYTKTETDDLLDKKANVDGNYPTLTSGLADNLTPYSEDSGAEQDNPFISNGTGTNNNTEIVTVGDYGLFKEKQGNTLVVNQLAKELNNTNWYFTDANVSYNNGIATLIATAQDGRLNTTIPIINSHKYIVEIKIKLTTATNQVYVRLSGNNIINTNATTSEQTLYGKLEYSGSTNENATLGIRDGRTSDWDAIQVKDIKLIDLTQMFNGDIPQDLLDNPSHFSWYYNGSLAYNTGSLENANGVKLVSTGRNLFDKSKLVSGKYINENTGEIIDVDNRRATTEYFECISNTDYYLLGFNASGNVGGDYYCNIAWYDVNKTYISGYFGYNNSHTKSPANAKYYRVCSSSVSGNITISLYYTPEQGGEGYDKYYPYETPYVVDTGSEVLRKAGSVKDYKEPSGEITRNVGNIKLNSLSWGYESANSRFVASVSGMIAKTNNLDVFCPMYIASLSPIGSRTTDKTICGYSDGKVYVLDSAYTDATTFKNHFTDDDYLYFQLATPTTEQGTQFAENLPINDYGMIYWLDSNDELVGIPQGAKIFYPTNYKGFVDDMYSMVDGDSSAYVIQSELNAVDTKHDNLYAIMQENIGGALRHQLAQANSIDFLNTDYLDLSSLTWSYSGGITVFYASVSMIKQDTNNLLCPKYKTLTFGTSMSNNCIKIYTGGYLYIRDTSFNGDATAFKNAMKGMLLAYEKGE